MTQAPPDEPICPYLAHRQGPASRNTEPSNDNACYAHPTAGRAWSPLQVFQQSVLCLSGSHVRCTWLASAVERGVPPPPVAGGRVPVPAPKPFAGPPPAAPPIDEPAAPAPSPGTRPAVQRVVSFRLDDAAEAHRDEREPRPPPRPKRKWWPFGR